MKLTDLFDNKSTTISKKIIITEGIQHPEDLLFDDGIDGAMRAINELAELEKRSETITIKWDGFPSIIFGRDENGQLIIADKHMFAKIDKNTGKRIGLSTSSEDFENYDKNRGADRTDLYAKERILRPELEKIIPNTPANRNKFYFGDLLWAGQLKSIDGYYTFTPNTVTYKIKQDSELGKRIANAKGGIAVHTFIPGLGKDETPLKGIGNLPKNGPVVFLSGEMTEKPTIDIDKNLIKKSKTVINQNKKAAEKFVQMLLAARAKSVISAMKTFITYKIKQGNFDNLSNDFIKYLPEKLTNDSARRNAAQLLSTSDGKNGLNAMWTIWLTITNLKIIIKKQIDAEHTDPNIPVQAFTGDIAGHEGYVFGIGEDKLKIINRLEFSKANFEKTRTDPKELSKRSSMPLAAFTFGRMNPPTLGHKLVMDKVASIGGANTFIFLSSKHDSKTDPLNYQTKIAFAKKMFPNHANQIVMDQVINPIYAANYLYKKGFRNLTFVAGSDRLGSGPGSLENILRNWNSGEVRHNDNTISNREEVVLNFVSSGDRDPDAEGVSSYSATKARVAAVANNKKEFYRFTGANDGIKVNNETLFDAVRKGMGLKTINEFMDGTSEHLYGTIATLKLQDNCARKLKKWCDKHNIQCLDPQDLHCTVLYSKKPVPKFMKINDKALDISAKIVGWKKLGNALVLDLNCPKATKLHDWMIKNGGTHDYPDFIAHVSVAYGYDSDQLPKVKPDMTIDFNKLKIKPIDPDWGDDHSDD
jgi:hypothetical protein